MSPNEITSVIEENERRKKAINAPYNPYTGEGSPIPRTKISYIHQKIHYTKWFPTEMIKHYPALVLLGETGSPERTFNTNDLIILENIFAEITEERFKYDFEFWAFCCVKITDKLTKRSISFVLNRAQRRLLAKMEQMRRKGKPIRICLLKARQWGGSTLVQVYMAWMQIIKKENWHSAIVADVDDQSRNIRGMYRRLAKAYPKAFGTVTFAPYEGSNKNKIIVERNCILGVGSAQEPDNLRSYDFSMLHLSEVGLWRSTLLRTAEDLVQSVRSTVPAVPDSLIVVESTAKGVGNFFHREWLAAKTGKSNYAPVFVPWYEIEIYQNKIQDSELRAFVKWVLNNEYARKLWNLGATLEGIKWYYDTKDGENYDDWRMKSEYPSDDIEAFQSTGRRIFSSEYVQKARTTCRVPEFVGELIGDAMSGPDALKNVRFEKNDKGCLSIWAMPDNQEKIAHRYALFGDIGGRTDRADYSCIRVLDRYWMIDGGPAEMVATWWGHLDQDLFAWKAVQLALFYNYGLLAIETNSLRKEKITAEGDHFITVLDEIAPYYSNLFARTDPEKIRQKAPIKWGFHTNAGTKTLILNTQNAALRDDLYVERDIRACDEMDTMEYKLDGSVGAVDGCHDDIAITTCGANWLGLKFMPLPHTVVPFTKKQKVIQSEASF